MRRKLRLSAAVLMSMILTVAFTSTPAFAAEQEPFSILSFFAKAGNKVVVTDVDYDRDDREVEFEFKGSVKWKKPKVKITRNGKNYAKRIIEKDSDELSVKVKKLTYGAIYSYKITGVKKKGAKKYTTVTGTFRAVDD